MTFRGLIDQRRARLLLQAVLRSGRVAHAYLFVGPSGVGRMTAARAFAQALLCAAGGDDACDRCTSCRKVGAGAHPDLRVLTPGRSEAGADRRAVGIDQVRELKREAAYPPYEARWKVFIVEHAEAMRAEAANSLLKVLEEPPPGVVIILITESAEAVLPTLASRAQAVRFSFVPAPEIAQALTARCGVAPERARYLAALAGGRVGAALADARSGEVPFERRREVVATLAALRSADVLVPLAAAEAVARQKEDIERWLDIALLWIRDVAVWQETQDPALLVNLDAVQEIAAWAGGASGVRLRRAAAAIEEAKSHLRRNLNPRLVLEALFVRIARHADRDGVRRP